MAAHPKKRKTNDVLCIKNVRLVLDLTNSGEGDARYNDSIGQCAHRRNRSCSHRHVHFGRTSGEITAGLSGRAHRLWLLVAYLIVNRDRGVSPQELIDLLWPEVTSNNPASTLQNNVSRARALFSEANFDDARFRSSIPTAFIIGLPNVRLFSIQRSSRPMCVASETFFLLKILKESISLLKLVSFTRAIF